MDAQLIVFLWIAAGMIAMPGADFAIVVRHALDSRRAGVAAAFGVAGGLVVHTALAVAGLAAVLVAFPALFRAVQLVGGGYLLFLGARSLLDARRSAHRPPAGPPEGAAASSASSVPPAPSTPSGAGHAVPVAPAAPAGGTARGLRQGFLTNVLNPKAPVFFLALLPQFVPAGHAAVPRTALLAGLAVAMGLVWFPSVALAVDGLGRWLRRPRTALALQYVTGAVLLALGGALLAEPLLK